MQRLTRRELLTVAALTSAVPGLLVNSAYASRRSAERHDGRVVVVVRMLGGNDGLNTVIPVRDDRYYAARPAIAIPRTAAIPLAGGELGLHPALAEFHELMESGSAGIVQAVGYPESSRSHVRATEIWETGSIAGVAPHAGWLGSYLEADCDCAAAPVAGVQFGDTFGTTLASAGDRARLIGHPELLAQMDAADLRRTAARGPASAPFAALARTQNALADVAALLDGARSGSGARYEYPDTAFGNALRWTGDMIETEAAPRAYYLTVGSFADGAASFDTHVDQLPKHELLYRELGRGVRAFAKQLTNARVFDRVLLVTFSDFGRLLAENRTRGTEHGDASVLLYAGGAVQPGLLGATPSLADTPNGGVRYAVDFRAVYADILRNWLRAPALATNETIAPFSILAA